MIVEYAIDPPFEGVQPTDTFVRNGPIIEHWRGATMLAFRALGQSSVIQQKIIGGSVASLLLEVNMPGQNVSMTNVRENANTGAIVIDFSSGTQLEVPGWEAVGEIADSLDAAPNFAEKILLGKAYRASPDGANKTTQIGASVSVNLLANEPVVYTDANG